MGSETNNSNLGTNDSGSLRGRVIGDFEIIEEVGRGGMGVVFRARQLSLDRIVALKVLSNNLGLTEHAVTRFRREAQATAKLHHANIVPIYAQGQQDSTYFYAMELVSGTSLFDILKSLREKRDVLQDEQRHARSSAKVIPVDETADVRTDLALAETTLLDRYAGSTTTISPGARGMSVSDSGVVIGHVDEGGWYSLSYFDEIARQIRGVADALEYAHRHGVIHRDIKPHNLLVGDRGRLCLSDFGLARVLEQPGVTVTGEFVGSPLYMSPEQMTGGKEPVRATTDIYSLGATLYEWMTLAPPFPGQTREQVIAKVITGDLVPPRALNSRIPVDLETICLKALDKNHKNRYQSAGDMRDDLTCFLDRDHIKAKRAGVFTSIAKHVSKRRVAAVAAFAAIVTVTLSVMLVKEQQAGKRNEQVMVSTQEAVKAVTEENKKLQEEKNQLVGLIEKFNLGQQFASAVKAEGFLSGILPASDAEPDKYIPLTDAQRIGAMFLSEMRQKLAAEYAEFDGIAEGSAEDYFRQAFVEERSAQAALQLINESVVRNGESVDSHLLRAWICCQLSIGNTMLRDAQKVINLAPEDGRGYLVRAVSRLLMDDPGACIDDLNKAASVLGNDYRFDVLIGICRGKIGEPDRAMVAFSRALTLNPDCVLALHRRAIHSFADKHYDVAIVDLTRIVEVEPENAEAYEMRGDCYQRLGRFNEARDDYLVAVKISGKPSLYFKAGTAAANFAEQLDKESKEEQGAQLGTGSQGNTLTPQDSDQSGALRKWVDRIKKGYIDTNARSCSLLAVDLGCR